MVSRKRNSGAVQVVALGVVGASSVYMLGLSMLAEHRSKQLDRDVLRALSGVRASPRTHLSPPVRDGRNTSPRLRELAMPHDVTVAWDDRKREIIAQASRGDIAIGRDRFGDFYIALPQTTIHDFEFSRRRSPTPDFAKRNGRCPRVWERPWALGQIDDPVFGSYGVLVEDGRAEIYRYDGRTWVRTGNTATWNAARGRLEGASIDPEMLKGIERAVLASPKARHAFVRGHVA
jgi:hypothetical protein